MVYSHTKEEEEGFGASEQSTRCYV